MGTKNIEIVRVALVDERPLVCLGVKRLMELHGAEMSLVWDAASVEEACVRMHGAPPDVFVVGAHSAAQIDAALPRLCATARVLVMLDRPAPDLQDRAIMAGAQGAVGLRDDTDMLVRAIRKVHEGEIWLDRVATRRILGHMARPESGNARAGLPVDKLTQREKDILAAMISSSELGAKRIADRLGISESTLRNHLTSIYGKLGVSSRVEMFAFAHRHGLTHVDRVA
jgi:DNA-binding NarL/FixJ family response regulator